MGKDLVFQAANNHVDSCGKPPKISSGSGRYCSYYENIHGEQWVFVGDVESEKFKVYGGDIGWDNVQVCDLSDPDIKFDLVLDQGETLWLKACVVALLELIDWKNQDYDGIREQHQRIQRQIDRELKDLS